MKNYILFLTVLILSACGGGSSKSSNTDETVSESAVPRPEEDIALTSSELPEISENEGRDIIYKANLKESLSRGFQVKFMGNLSKSLFFFDKTIPPIICNTPTQTEIIVVKVSSSEVLHLKKETGGDIDMSSGKCKTYSRSVLYRSYRHVFQDPIFFNNSFRAFTNGDRLEVRGSIIKYGMSSRFEYQLENAKNQNVIFSLNSGRYISRTHLGEALETMIAQFTTVERSRSYPIDLIRKDLMQIQFKDDISPRNSCGQCDMGRVLN